ncbi:endoplasmic reticulum resident protein 27 [Ctenodactylus gundi]
MEATPSKSLFLLFLLAWGQTTPGVAAESKETSDGPIASREPTWLADVPAAQEFIAAAEVVIVGFFQDLEIPGVSTFRSLAQEFPDVPFGMTNDSEVLSHYNITRNTISLFRVVDNEQLVLDGEDVENMDATKISRFIEVNSIRMVTEYNSLTAVGLFSATIEIHLLLMMNKSSPGYEETIRRYQQAAWLFQGQILFVLVDSGIKENGRVISYFKLKESQLPALAIYRTLDDKWDTLPIAEVTIEQIQTFCDRFLKEKLLAVTVKTQMLHCSQEVLGSKEEKCLSAEELKNHSCTPQDGSKGGTKSERLGCSF